MQEKKNLQDTVLNSLRKDRQPATVFLTNGFQLKGTVTGFDSFVVVLQSDAKQQIIYKHAISTIVPLHAVRIYENYEKEQQTEQTEVVFCR